MGLVPNSCALVNPDLVIFGFFWLAKLRINEGNMKKNKIFFIFPSESNSAKFSVCQRALAVHELDTAKIIHRTLAMSDNGRSWS